MTPHEVICTWMEPNPQYSGPMTSDGGWWVRSRPRQLDLDALWEVEERLIRMGSGGYVRGQLLLSNPELVHEWHATPEQKIKALAAVLRPLVEGASA